MTTAASSPPLTPPPRPPTDHERRFRPISTLCEWVEHYYPGSYHPVHLGDILHAGQYTVLRKLGYGAYSTVWLARDAKHSRYVALKILVSTISAEASEAQILHHLARAAPAEVARFVTPLLDEFTHDGPNGSHRCLVFESMGPSANSMVEQLPQFNPRRRGIKVRYPPAMACSILRQALQGLEFLHGHGIVHSDLQPGNLLFALDSLDTQPQDALRQDEHDQASISPPVQRQDGKQDYWAPRYLCVPRPLALASHDLHSLKVKLSDLGGAYFFSNPPAKIVTPLGLRAPELILKDERSASLDIWSFGCLVFELVTGTPLFCVPYSNGLENDEHLLDLISHIGPLPDDVFQAWQNYSLYFTPEGELYNCQLGGAPEGAKPLMLEQTTMEEAFDQAKPDVDDAEAAQIKALVRRILRYDPAQRPSATEILSDPWFSSATTTAIATEAAEAASGTKIREKAKTEEETKGNEQKVTSKV